MELRSSRSRSRTPFLKTGYEEEEAHSEANVITRVTRSTTYKSYDTSYTGEEVSQSSQRNARSGKAVRHGRYKTSDYSSEDGDNEVTSTDIEQNSKNSRLEQSRHSNGSGLSALKIYRDAREYWNRYPKTDYTYSRHSKDRVEIAPGVINMPNMSRKSIHESGEIMDLCNKETNTETITEQKVEQMKLRPRALFHRNNNRHEEYEFHQQTHRIDNRTTIVTWVYTVFTSMVSSFFGLFYRLTQKQNAWLHSVGRVLHKIASKVMHVDTWLLMGQDKFNKTNALLGLCLIPLLLLGGLWWVASMSQIAGLLRNYTEEAPPKPAIVIETSAPQIIENIVRIQLNNPHQPGFTSDQLETIANSLKSTLNLDLDTGTIIKIMLGDPSMQKIDLLYPQVHTKLQETSTNTYDINKIISGVLNSPDLKTVIQTNGRSNSEIEELRVEIGRLEANLASMMLQQKTNAQLLNRELKSCCRRSFLQVERHVSQVLMGLLDKPAYKEDMLGWLNTVFVAKHDLESHINKATGNLKSEFDILIENNANKLMDEVMARMLKEIDAKNRGQINVARGNTMPSDDYIRGIVKNVLAIYDADKTGLVDYALEPAGGQIISTRCTESFKLNTAVVSVLGIPIWYPSYTPRVVISPGIVPGECWAFQSFPGYLLIKLSSNISIEAFSYEHINKMLTPSGRVDSAPRNFSVHGFTDQTDREPKLLGQYVYDNEGDPLQTFPVQRKNSHYDLVELRVHSNHGNSQFTCLYRFRVHGKLVPT